ncbi:Hypothetical predicted protein [Mytilus galloprovincialis]|uniref:Uncharacterized protein n=1 Tax=Mytilus galloprovincialis TaxID=29158 RepID=A0A8B6G3E7_MYTGA|nr:Hypothetical predicted protein [Mytilus galloprovincialis]
MIGVTKRVLDSILLENVKGGLTHEVLITLMAEVTAIVNSRPLVEVSTDPEDPIPLTPAMLLTQKPNLITIENTFDMTNMYRALTVEKSTDDKHDDTSTERLTRVLPKREASVRRNGLPKSDRLR